MLLLERIGTKLMIWVMVSLGTRLWMFVVHRVRNMSMRWMLIGTVKAMCVVWRCCWYWVVRETWCCCVLMDLLSEARRCRLGEARVAWVALVVVVAAAVALLMVSVVVVMVVMVFAVVMVAVFAATARPRLVPGRGGGRLVPVGAGWGEARASAAVVRFMVAMVIGICC